MGLPGTKTESFLFIMSLQLFWRFCSLLAQKRIFAGNIKFLFILAETIKLKLKVKAPLLNLWLCALCAMLNVHAAAVRAL